MREGLLSLLQTAFKIRPDEAHRTGLAFVYLFTAIGAFIIGRIARTVLFLEIPNYREQLPLVYVGIAVTVALAMSAYARVEGKLRRDRTNALTLCGLIVGTLAFRAALWGGGEAVYWAFYIWVEVIGAFLIVQFWTLTNELFNSRQAKRVFAFIGGGGVLANIVLGLAIKQYVHLLGTENLLYVLVLCLGISLVAVIKLGKNGAAELETARERRRGGTSSKRQVSPTRRVLSTRHVQFVAGVVVLTYLVSYLADYQLNVIVGDSIPLKDDRSAFFATFFAVTGVIGGFVQFFLTARILERFGVLFALLLLPIAMLGGSVGMLTVTVGVLPGLWAASITKGSEFVLRYTVNDTTLQLLYLPLPAQVRGRAKAVVDGILKPVSIGAAGLLLALLVGKLDQLAGISLGFVVDVYDLSWLVAAALVGWIVTLLGLRREYFKTLLQTLQRRRLNLDEAKFQISDPATLRILEDALATPDITKVLHALELLPNVAPKLREPLDTRVSLLLHHESDEVRVAALSYLGQVGAALHSDAVASLLTDPSDEVRATSALALCALKGTEALGNMHHMLEDTDPGVRAHAITGLVRYGGLDGVLACADHLKAMLGSEDADDRGRAAWILGKVGVQTFYQPLIPLLGDADERVRQAAIIASGELGSPELIPALVARLDDPALAGHTVAALAAYGDEAMNVAAEILADASQPSGVRAQAPRILARLQSSKGTAILSKHLLDDDPNVRGAAVQAVATLLHRVPEARLPVGAVGEALRVESQAYFTWVAMAEDLRLDSCAPLLGDALDHRQVQAQERVLSLLALKYPADTIDLVRRNLESPQASTRANAVEVLDNMLSKDEKPFLIPLLEDAPAERKLVAVSTSFRIPRASRSERLHSLLQNSDTWLQCCAAVAVGEWELGVLEPDVRAMLKSTSPVARETAVYVLPQLLSGSAVAEHLEPLKDDAHPLVRRYASHVLAEPAKA